MEMVQAGLVPAVVPPQYICRKLCASNYFIFGCVTHRLYLRV
jgi:hypothetical protein